MNKAQLVEKLAAQTGITKADSERILEATITTIKSAVKRSEDVTLVGFGTFTRLNRKSRKARNPQTGQLIEIPASIVPKFRAGKGFVEYLN